MKIDVKITFDVDSNAHVSLLFSDLLIIRELFKCYKKDRESFVLTEFIIFLIKTQRENISKDIFLHVFCKHKKPKWCQEKTKQKACFF